MARSKRYETAFIPATNSPAHYPDVDSLLFSIESFSLGGIELETVRRSKDEREVDYHHPRRRRRSKSVNHDNLLIKSGGFISTPLCQRGPPFGSKEEKVLSGGDKEQGRIRSLKFHYQNVQVETIDKHSRSESPVRKMPISLSEPLRPKHSYMKSYSSIQSSSGCSTTNSSSPVASETQRKSRKIIRTAIPKGNVFKLMKVNSVSSLDSIDSAKSEDLKYLGRKPNPHRPTTTTKVLSPISDKSPLEPTPTQIHTSQEPMTTDNCSEMIVGGLHWKKQSLLSAAEQLSNLPWEMPKLKRKIALLVDSGISLNYQGSSREIEPTQRKTEFLNFPLIRRQESDCRLWSKEYPFNSKHQNSMSRSKDLRRTESFLEPESEIYEETNEEDDEDEVKGDLHEGEGQTGGGDSPPSSQVPPPPEILQNINFKPDRCKMKLDFGDLSKGRLLQSLELIDSSIHLEGQDWFHGAITRVEAEEILRPTREGSFLVRNCESTVFNRYSLSLKSSRGFIHVRIEPNPSSGEFSIGDELEEFLSVPSLVLHFMSHRLPIKGAEHVLLKYPLITNLL